KQVIVTIRDRDTSVDMSRVYFGLTETGYDFTGGKWLMSNGVLATRERLSNSQNYFSYHPNNEETLNKIFQRFYIQIEKGTIPSDWSPAPEDNYTQEEFKIFESTYNEDVKGINSTLTDLSNKKLDGSTYTNFYTNEYKKTAQGVTDTYTKVNKIIDANGNSTDAFAKAVYDRNASRQSADFKNVTKDLVKTATYTAGIDGVKQSITSVQGKIDDLSGARNLLKQSWHNSKDSPAIISTSYGIKSWELEKPLELGKTYTFRLFGYTNREMLRLFTPNGMKVLVNNMSHTSSNIIRRDNPYN